MRHCETQCRRVTHHPRIECESRGQELATQPARVHSWMVHVFCGRGCHPILLYGFSGPAAPHTDVIQRCPGEQSWQAMSQCSGLVMVGPPGPASWQREAYKSVAQHARQRSVRRLLRCHALREGASPKPRAAPRPEFSTHPC